MINSVWTVNNIKIMYVIVNITRKVHLYHNGPSNSFITKHRVLARVPFTTGRWDGFVLSVIWRIICFTTSWADDNWNTRDNYMFHRHYETTTTRTQRTIICFRDIMIRTTTQTTFYSQHHDPTTITTLQKLAIMIISGTTDYEFYCSLYKLEQVKTHLDTSLRIFVPR